MTDPKSLEPLTQREIESFQKLDFPPHFILVQGQFRNERAVFICEGFTDENNEQLMVPVALLLSESDLKECLGPDGDATEIMEYNEKVHPVVRPGILNLPMV